MIFPVLLVVEKIQHGRRTGIPPSAWYGNHRGILANDIQQALLVKYIQVAAGESGHARKGAFLP